METLLVKNSVRLLCTQNGRSQTTLAERLAVSRQTVHAIETGKYDPSLPLAFRLAKLFGLKIGEVFDPEE